MTKKGHQKFSVLKWKFFPKKGHSKTLVREIFSRPPKVGAKSPPMVLGPKSSTDGGT